MSEREILIKDTHRGLWYEDGVVAKVLGAGRYEMPKPEFLPALRRIFGLKRKPTVEVVLVDMRARELTIKGQEILTADKVAIRVSILVQFAVVDPKAALHAVASYEDRLYSDVQLAARRSLASMPFSRHRNVVKDPLQNIVGRESLGVGLEADQDPVAHDVEGQALDVVGRHKIATG